MRIIFILLCLLPINLMAASPKKIIASIRPLQSIIANLTKGIDEVDLIIDHNESLHNYQLKPTKIRNLHKSDMIIIIDRNFEVFLDKILTSLDKKKIIEVAKLPDVNLLLNEEDEHEHEHHGHHHPASQYDYHLWTDINVVKAIAKGLSTILIAENPSKGAKYQQNLLAFLEKLDDLDHTIKAKLIGTAKKNFIVTHNAYQYFIHNYGLTQPKAITIDHDNNIGARSFLELQKSIADNQIKCVFEEPQFESIVITKLKERSKVRIGTLDAEWGPDDGTLDNAYFAMMLSLADSFSKCLR